MRRALRSALAALTAVALVATAQAQNCRAPGKDVLLFMDNSNSIENFEYEASQRAAARVAEIVLARPGYRLAVVNWGCNGNNFTRDGCSIDLATGSAIPGGWSSRAADFAFVDLPLTSRKVCRSFGDRGTSDRCGRVFNRGFLTDFAQDALRVLDNALFAGGSPGVLNSFSNTPTAPTRPTQPLVVIHMTDGRSGGLNEDDSILREVPTAQAGLGHYYYSNRLKNERGATIIGIGVDENAATPAARAELGGIASKGGTGADYDADHSSAASTRAADRGTPRLTGFSQSFDSDTMLQVTSAALDATIPACVAIAKQSNRGIGSFTFGSGTNGLPARLELKTDGANPQVSSGFNIEASGSAASITETLPAGWSLDGAQCVDANNAAVPGTVLDARTGQLTIPGAQLNAGRRMTCTFTNTASTDLSILKEASPAAVKSGSPVTFKLKASNAGPGIADNALLRDVPGAGLTCSEAPTCTASGSAVCPSAASLSAGALLSTGVAIPKLPAGGAVEVSLACTVTASGTP